MRDALLCLLLVACGSGEIAPMVDAAPEDAEPADAAPDVTPDAQCPRIMSLDHVCGPFFAYQCNIEPAACFRSTDPSVPFVWCCP